MQYNWKPVIKSLLKHLEAEGFIPFEVNNGGEDEATPTWKDVLKEIDATDESHVYLKHPSVDKILWLFVVLGNEPWETVCDYSCNDHFDKAIEAFQDKWEGKSCPIVKVKN
jgi:hypothetical protein